MLANAEISMSEPGIDNQNRAEIASKGGQARAAKLSPEERQAIASEAARRRWGARSVETHAIPRVLEGFKGVLNLAGMQLPSAIIKGPNGIQRVLSENGITNAILGTRSGASKRLKKAASEEGALLPLFLAPRQLKPYIDADLTEGPLKPIDYLDGDRVVRGYDASVLVAVCNIWLRAREAGALQSQQLKKAQKAEILTRALAHTGIAALVDEATGYEKVRPQNALQEYLALILRKELAAWVKKFPDEFYENIYKIKGWSWPGMSKNRYSVVGHYTNNLVFDRIASGLLKELQSKSPKNEKGNRSHKLHQWLTEDIGDPMLAQHLHSIVMFQRFAIVNGYGWQRFLHMVDQVLPRRGDTLQLPLDIPETRNASMTAARPS
jgi:P63C domain